jgi:eukaryotic-like serine/threonine-protein kinase
MASLSPPSNGQEGGGAFEHVRTRALAPGDRLDRYELLSVLAQGGMGTVWLARLSGKLGFERLVALKTILPTYSGDRQFCDMFLDEAKLAARIDHENVARILEIGEDSGLLYYAMELIDGESLRKVYRDVRAAKAEFPLGIALRIVADACAGLHATHELRDDAGRPLQVVHRDVSPQNLLVSVRGTTKLIDFGVAKANARSSEETVAGTLKGKLEYMAPEQARGLALDRRADVYALGAVLYELLAGRPVRVTDEGRQLAALHELMTDVPVAPLPESLPLVVRQIVDRAISADASRRFGSAEELRRALEHAMLATGERATTNDVAAMLAHFSGERTAKRKDAIDRALRVAVQGRLDAATIVAPLGAIGGAGSSPGGHAAYGPATSTGPFLPLSSPSLAGLDGPSTGPSMRTPGPASMSARPMPGASAAKVAGGLLVLGIVAVLGVVIGVVLTRRGQEGVVVAASPRTTACASPTSEPAVPATPASVAKVTGAEVAPSGRVNDPTAAPATSDASNVAAGPTRKPDRKPTGKPSKPGVKPGDGDDYGF